VHAQKRVGKRFGGTFFNQVTSAAVFNNFRNSTNRKGYDRHSG
jgi:hypothetical protein